MALTWDGRENCADAKSIFKVLCFIPDRQMRFRLANSINISLVVPCRCNSAFGNDRAWHLPEWSPIERVLPVSVVVLLTLVYDLSYLKTMHYIENITKLH